MRVGLVIYGTLDTVSGGYLYDRQLVDHLRRCGDTVDVLSMPWGPYGRRLAQNLVPAYREMMLAGYDVVLQDELNHPSLAWLNGRLSPRPPVVSIVHHLRVSERRPRLANRFYAFVERRYLRSVDAFVFNSRTTEAAVRDLSGLARPSVVAYPAGDRLGAPLSEAEVAARAAAGPLRLLFAGNLIPRKGLHTLLEAVARLPGEWEVAVAGSPAADPRYARAQVARVERAGLGERVRFLGPLPDADLAALMARSHVLVVPSSYEGFGIVYIEGMAFGLPAIATTAGAAGEIITNGVDGYLIAPDDAAALAERLAALAADRALLARLSAAALARFGRHPTWEQSAAAVRAFLQEIIP